MLLVWYLILLSETNHFQFIIQRRPPEFKWKWVFLYCSVFFYGTPQDYYLSKNVFKPIVMQVIESVDTIVPEHLVSMCTPNSSLFFSKLLLCSLCNILQLIVIVTSISAIAKYKTKYKRLFCSCFGKVFCYSTTSVLCHHLNMCFGVRNDCIAINR